MDDKERNLRRRDRIVREILDEWYEPGRHDRCKRWVYRNKVLHQIPMSERSFYRCLRRERERLRAASNETDEVDE